MQSLVNQGHARSLACEFRSSRGPASLVANFPGVHVRAAVAIRDEGLDDHQHVAHLVQCLHNVVRARINHLLQRYLQEMARESPSDVGTGGLRGFSCRCRECAYLLEISPVRHL